MADLSPHLVFDPLLPAVWTAGVTLVLVVATVASAWRWALAAPPGRRRVLVTLRLLAVAALAVMMLRPQVRWEGRRHVLAEVTVLLDASRSMGIRDADADAAAEAGDSHRTSARVGADGPVTRAEAVRRAFSQAADAYAALAKRAAVRPLAFGSDVRAAEGLSVEPSHPRTDLAQALRAVAARARRPAGPFESPPADVIVLSDGRVNRHAGEEAAAARELADLGVAVHTVLVGASEPGDGVCDVAVRGLRAPDRVFVGNKAEVRATVALLGLAGKPVEVVLSVNGKPVERRRVTPLGGRDARELCFTPTLEAVGPCRLAVSVQPLTGELVTTNNRAETTVRVEQGGIRVLYVDGRLHPEGKYLARVLGDAREIELERRVLVGAGAKAAAPRPADLVGVDVLLLGDLSASALPPETVDDVARRVRAGDLSLLTLAGGEAYGGGGWSATPLAPLLPFDVPASDGKVDGPLAFRPTAEGLKHFIFRGEEGEAMPPPASLPPLAEANAVGLVRPGARLLAEAPGGEPLLAVRDFGGGRVASVTFDTSWQWALAPEKTGGPDLHRRLWRRLVLWLAGRDGRPKDAFWIMTDRTEYVVVDPARPPEAEVTVGLPGDAPPKVTVQGAGQAEVRLRRIGGARPGRSEWRGRVGLGRPGEITLSAEAPIGGEAKRIETKVTVRELDFELADLLADPGPLVAVAEAGGGTFRRLDGLPDLLRSLADGMEPRYVPAENRLSLGRGRPFLAVFVGLLAAEWVLRRSWRMA